MTQPTPSFHLSDFENLQEDLSLLQTSLEQNRVDPLRAQVQCADILSAVSVVSDEQQLPEYAAFVQKLADFVHETTHPQESLGPEFWSLTLDVLDELLAALEMRDAGLKIDDKAVKRHNAAFETRLHTLIEVTSTVEGATPARIPNASAAPAPTAEPPPPTPTPEPKAEPPPAESAPEPEVESPVADTSEPVAPPSHSDGRAQALLEQAAQAAREGRAGEAQQLAAEAATALAGEARQIKERELAGLREQLLDIEHAGKNAVAEVKEADGDREHWNTAQAEARASHAELGATFETHAADLGTIKSQLEEVEGRMAQLQTQQQELMQRFEQALPAKEEAERALQQAATEVEAREAGVREAEARRQQVAERTATLRDRRTVLQDQISALEHEIGAAS